jgi:hypothetical protein
MPTPNASGVANAPGHFRLSLVETIADHKLYNWALFNKAGDLIAASPYPASAETAKETVEWIIHNSERFIWDNRVFR